MAGVKGLRKIQIGLEATSAAGTAVACTAVLRLNGMPEDARTVTFPEEQTGYLGGTDRAYTPRLLAIFEMEGEATFEQLPYILNAAIGAATATQDGAGSDYIYAYTFPTTSAPAINTYTLEAGDNQEAERMEYGYVSEFSLSGTAGEAWMLSATWQGRQLAVSSFSASTTLSTVEEMLFGKTKMYIDAATASVGTSLQSNTLLAAELKVTTGWIPKFAADGQLYYSRIENVGDEITLDITFEHDASGAAQKVLWRSGSPVKVRLLCEGTSVASAGTTYTYKTCKIDLAGKWEKFEKIDEIDGNDVLKGTLRVRYNGDGTPLKGAITIVNEVAALP
jgi:hypothetical protein